MQCCKYKPNAVARVVGGEDVPQLSGCVQFYQENGCVLIVADVSGLPKANETGFFGFHIHQGRDCSGAGFFGTEGHYNPLGQGIRNTQAICHRCYGARETHNCP